MAADDASAWIHEQACDRRLRHLEDVAKDAPDMSKVFSDTHAPGYMSHIGLRRFAISTDTSSEEYVRSSLACAFAHIDPLVTTAIHLDELAKPHLNEADNTVDWRLKVNCFGEPLLSWLTHGYVTVELDIPNQLFNVYVLWCDREKPFNDDYVKSTAINLSSESEVLSLLRNAHAWGANVWLRERSVLEAKRAKRDDERKRRLDDALANMPR